MIQRGLKEQISFKFDLSPIHYFRLKTLQFHTLIFKLLYCIHRPKLNYPFEKYIISAINRNNNQLSNLLMPNYLYISKGSLKAEGFSKVDFPILFSTISANAKIQIVSG